MFYHLKIVDTGTRTGRADRFRYHRYGLVLVHAAGPLKGQPVETYRRAGKCHAAGDPVPVITTTASWGNPAPQWMHRAVRDAFGRNGITLEEAGPFTEWHRRNCRKPGGMYDLRPGARVDHVIIREDELEPVEYDVRDGGGAAWAAK